MRPIGHRVVRMRSPRSSAALKHGKATEAPPIAFEVARTANPKIVQAAYHPEFAQDILVSLANMLTNGTPRSRDRGIVQGLPRAGGAEQRGQLSREAGCGDHSSPSFGVSVSYNEASSQLSSYRRRFCLVSASISHRRPPNSKAFQYSSSCEVAAARVMVSRAKHRAGSLPRSLDFK